MNEDIKTIAVRILPAFAVRHLRRLTDPVRAVDLDRALDYKGDFFWNAFKALDLMVLPATMSSLDATGV